MIRGLIINKYQITTLLSYWISYREYINPAEQPRNAKNSNTGTTTCSLGFFIANRGSALRGKKNVATQTSTVAQNKTNIKIPNKTDIAQLLLIPIEFQI